jgi:hypothetical protein
VSRGSGLHLMAGIYDPRAEMAATQSREAARQARCAEGEHDVRVAQQGYATYICGRRVQPGTRYCHFCAVILAGDTACDTPGREEGRAGGSAESQKVG